MRASHRDGRSIFAGTRNSQERQGADLFARADMHFGATAFVDAGSIARAQPPLPNNLLIVTPDEAGDGIGLAPGNPVLTVGAPSTIATLGTLGDQDFFQVTLEAGKTYEFGMFGQFPGPNFLPVQDAYLELYAANGSLLASADGGASTLVNNVNSGFDAVLTFTATTSGTYYVNARAFDNDPTVGGNTGESIGDYALYAAEVDPDDPNVYHPYYQGSSPLYAIDWGSQVNKVNVTARNPDGDEGTRDTGNAQGTPVFGDPVLISTLAAEQGISTTGKNVITIYFAKAGDIFTSIEDPTSPGLPPATITATGVQQFEHDAVMTALGEFSKVADVVYLEVQDRTQADFVYTSYLGTPGPGVSLLGSMSPPDESDEGLAQFNSGDERWNEVNLAQGGFSFVTLIHEFGHGHGLAHPHDNGGHSGIMNGVESDGPVADYTTGDFALNQGVFTMMSYEDGWQSSPYGNAETDVGYGYLGGLMAFDIAAIQDKYGVNEEWATGDDIYVMKDENEAGTFYYSIWDGGGLDTIVYGGARNANIDLRAASLRYEAGGGGWVSFADGIYGGFTIANGVTIENATSGAGNDILTGNAAANGLIAGAGDDLLYGADGNDSLHGQSGIDGLLGGLGDDFLSGDDGDDSLHGQEGSDVLVGGAGKDFLSGDAGADVMYGGTGDDVFVSDFQDYIVEHEGEGFDLIYASSSYTLSVGQHIEIVSAGDANGTAAIDLGGNDLDNILWANAAANLLTGGLGDDKLHGFGGIDGLLGGEGNDFLDGGDGDDSLHGQDGIDTLVGGAGKDFLSGGAGADVAYGGAGDDIYVADAGDYIVEAANEGTDLVYASTSFTLSVGQHIEILSAGDTALTTAIDLTGNELANNLWGNGGANRLDGGAGADVLIGYGGNDVFTFTTAAAAGNADIIADFAAGSDRIALDDAVFSGIGTPGAFNTGAFVTGSAAADANDRIVYNNATGQLFYDADGSGAGAAVLVATLHGNPILSASDFMVI